VIQASLGQGAVQQGRVAGPAPAPRRCRKAPGRRVFQGSSTVGELLTLRPDDDVMALEVQGRGGAQVEIVPVERVATLIGHLGERAQVGARPPARTG